MVLLEETLRLLGFSPIEARVYLTLIKFGSLDAKTLAKHSNVSSTDVKSILADFQKLKIIKKTLTNPEIFEAIPLKKSISLLTEQKAKQAPEKTEKWIHKVEQSHSFNTKFPEAESSIFLIPATEIALQKRKELIQKAQVSIDVISSWQHYKFLLKSNFNTHTKKAVDRNVKYRLIVETPKNVKLPPEHQEALKILDHNGSEFKYIPAGSSALMSLYDDREVLLLTSPDMGPSGSPMLWSSNDSIILMGKIYFENLWKKASEQPL